jgi:hypothetical protein
MNEEIKSGQEEMRFVADAWIADMKEDRKERTACQEAMEANPEKMEPNPGEQEATVEQQEVPIEEVTIHERMACQEATEVNPEKMESTDCEIAILEKMEDTDMRANPEEVESESEH